MRGRNGRSRFVLVMFLLVGLVLGLILSYYLRGYPGFAWLDYGKTFGLTGPVTLSLADLFSITFGVTVKINIGSLAGIALGYAAYRFAER